MKDQPKDVSEMGTSERGGEHEYDEEKEKETEKETEKEKGKEEAQQYQLEEADIRQKRLEVCLSDHA